MKLTKQNCLVCSKNPASGFNYGAYVCNSCKMFFRRVILRKSIKDCENEGVCISMCRPCRFQKCLQAGMTFNPYSPGSDLHNNEVILFAIINNLQHIDNHREKLFNNYLFNGNPSFIEVLGDLDFKEKPPNLKYTYKDWGFIQSITGIDFFKKISFMKKLTLLDQIAVLKKIFKQFSIFSLAHSCYTTKQSRLSFPNGSEIPEPNLYGVSDNLRTRIQGRLLARLIELKVSKQEFLLVSVLMLCDPCAPNLSDHGKILITTQQRYYASALLQHCLINYQTSGPSRFTDLLFIPQAIFSTFDDLKADYQLCEFYKTSDRLHTKKIFYLLIKEIQIYEINYF